MPPLLPPVLQNGPPPRPPAIPVHSVPLTGRKRTLLTSASYEASAGDQAHSHILSRSPPLPPSHPASRTVSAIGRRLLSSSPVKSPYPGPWTFAVISDRATPNAFAVPANHVVVYSGLFRYARTEDELAAVLAHEIGHVLARHAGEKMSGDVKVRGGAAALGALWGAATGGTGELARAAAAATGGLLSELPNSREMEREADYIGLRLMGAACFDIGKAANFFERMEREERAQGGGGGGSWLSTHPVHKERIDNIRRWSGEVGEEMRGRGQECERVRRDWEIARRGRPKAGGGL
ncbi:hypothetical protein TeGR_g11258 [Tetraparma gracilis]|uniref:Peptidase M48 domain-containing protein n=1 Tax=Tetraparma gracilis TaxID=2962635 RepID=A0ABQ6N6X4_9STRA|nr:hypothetical protein TeGR_g11258 [Tetraparma gracilis]